MMKRNCGVAATDRTQLSARSIDLFKNAVRTSLTQFTASEELGVS
jgi:hypothetical protein